MKRELKRVVWEWMPGQIAGILPLGVFGTVSALVAPPPLPPGHPAMRGIHNGLMGHLLVFAMVTSSVSTFTAFPRLFLQSHARKVGPSSLMLVLATTLTLVFSTALYTLHEAHAVQANLSIFAVGTFLVAMMASFAIEFAIANLSLSERGRSDAEPEPNVGVVNDQDNAHE